jgi:hypothetical protein
VIPFISTSATIAVGEGMWGGSASASSRRWRGRGAGGRVERSERVVRDERFREAGGCDGRFLLARAVLDDRFLPVTGRDERFLAVTGRDERFLAMASTSLPW